MRPNQTNEERLRAYPNPEIKKERLDVFQKMLQVTQSLLVGKQNVGINQTMQEPRIAKRPKKRNQTEVQKDTQDRKQGKNRVH